MRMLLDDSRASPSKIGAEIGVSSRTVRRRLALLAENQAFFVDPIVDFKQMRGFLYLFVLSFSGRREKIDGDRLLSKSSDPIIFIDTSSESYTVIAAVCQNVSLANRMSTSLRSIRGVKKVMSWIVEDRILVHDWLQQEMERRVAAFF